MLGGNGDDVLHGGGDDDLLDGGAGNDTLDASVGDDILLGGIGNDVLLASGGNDVLVGGDGDDHLDGGSQDDILIGGHGTDRLEGRVGEDILLGGDSAYDNDLARLEAPRNLWTAPLPYLARVAALTSSRSPAHFTAEQTFFDDAVADELFGQMDQDWFILTGFLPDYVPRTRKQLAVAGPAVPEPRHSPDAPPFPGAGGLEGIDLYLSLDHMPDRSEDERVHSLIPHAEEPVRLLNHFAVFELVRYDQVTHAAVRDGDWSDPQTWSTGTLPGSTSRVLIPTGVDVTISAKLAGPVDTIRVDGTLRFATDRNTRLQADTIVVDGSGTLEIGTASDPVQAGVTARVTFTNTGEIDRVRDPLALGRGLISHGTVEIYGQQKTGHHVLAVEPLAGNTQLVLAEDPVGWQVDDKIVIAGTRALAGEDEERTIRAIVGNVIVVDPLDYDHTTPVSTQTLGVHVSNLTRNVQFSSAADEIDRRGHVMFMHSHATDVRYASFTRLGRTDKHSPIDDPEVTANVVLVPETGTNPRARYAVHFHRTGVDRSEPAIMMGSVVVDNPGWGFVNHSSNVDIIDNVAYDVDGAGFTAEAGDEIGSFRGNISISTHGSGEEINAREYIQDFGHQGDGFWFQGAGIHVTDNIAVNNSGHGFVFYTRGLREEGLGQAEFATENLRDPSIANGQPTISVGHVPIAEFARNVAYASATGLKVRYHLRNAKHDVGSIVEDSTFFNNVTGVDTPYVHNLTIRNLTVVQDPDVDNFNYGITNNSVTRNVRYQNLHVAGYRTGLNVPLRGTSIIDGGYWNNLENLRIELQLEENRSVIVQGAIVFDTLPDYVLHGRTPADVTMRMHPRPFNGSLEYVLLTNNVTLNYGDYQNQSLSFTGQVPEAVPFPEDESMVNEAYVGLSNLELWNAFGVATAGRLVPANYVTDSRIEGLIGLPGSGFANG